MLVDVRLIIDRRWAWVVSRVVGAAVLRFPILMLLPRHHAEVWLLFANAGPVALSGFIGVAALARRSRATPNRDRTREMVHFSLVNYAATLVSGAAIFVLPIIVLVSVTPSANANFYIAWGVVALTALLPAAIGQVLLVEGGRPDDSTDHVAVAALVAVGLMAAVAAVVFVAKGVVVAVYGPDYRLAARILPGLVLAGIPAAAGTILLTEARLRRDAMATVAMPAAASLTVLGLAFVLVPRMGVDGAVAAWLFGNIIGLVVALWVRRYRLASTAGETTRERAPLVSTRSM
jgi:O-antigen/teichoic acid export membrane protein